MFQSREFMLLITPKMIRHSYRQLKMACTKLVEWYVQNNLHVLVVHNSVKDIICQHAHWLETCGWTSLGANDKTNEILNMVQEKL